MVTTTAGMFKTCVIRLLISGLCILASLTAILLLKSGSMAKEQEGRWYFLSGTSTEDTDRHYPSVLYTVDSAKKLRTVRVVVSGEDGVHSIRQYGSAIFVLYPHLPPTTVSVVHTDNPSLPDNLTFNPDGKVVIDTRLAVAEPKPHAIAELVWLMAGPKDRRGGGESLASQRIGQSSTVLD